MTWTKSSSSESIVIGKRGTREILSKPKPRRSHGQTVHTYTKSSQITTACRIELIGVCNKQQHGAAAGTTKLDMATSLGWLRGSPNST